METSTFRRRCSPTCTRDLATRPLTRCQAFVGKNTAGDAVPEKDICSEGLALPVAVVGSRPSLRRLEATTVSWEHCEVGWLGVCKGHAKLQGSKSVQNAFHEYKPDAQVVYSSRSATDFLRKS